MASVSPEHQAKIEQSVEQNLGKSNELFYEFVKQLMLIATVLLTFTSPIVATENAAKFIEEHSNLFQISWACLILSIFFGLAQFFRDFIFFRGAAKRMHAFLEKIRLHEAEGRPIAASKGKIIESGVTFCIFQALFLAASLLCTLYSLILQVAK